MRMGDLLAFPPLLVLLLLQAAGVIAAAATAVRDKNRVPWGLIRSSFQFFKWPGGKASRHRRPQWGPRTGPQAWLAVGHGQWCRGHRTAFALLLSARSSPSEISAFSLTRVRPAAAAATLSKAAKSWSAYPAPIRLWMVSWTRAATGSGTSACRAAASPRSKSLRSKVAVKVGWKSRLTKAGAL